MKRGRRIWIVLLACGVLALVTALLWPKEREPEYNGKKLSEWVREYEGAKLDRDMIEQYGDASASSAQISAYRKKENEAADAVRQIGTNALPWLVAWVDYDCPRWKSWLTDSAQKAATRFGGGLGWWAKAYERLARRRGLHSMARGGFEILGGTARGAIPHLAGIARGRGIDSACGAIEALGAIGSEALPSLMGVVTNKTLPWVNRACAIDVLGFTNLFGSDADCAVSVIAGALCEPELALHAAASLGRLKCRSDIAVPALSACVQSTNAGLRIAAMEALLVFGNQARPAVPALLQVLEQPDHPVTLTWRPGIVVTETFPTLHETACNALRAIAPEVLETNGVSEGHGSNQ